MQTYVAILPGRIAESIERASRNLEPARIGWGAIDDHEHTFCRRWIRRPDKMLDDPFGQRTVRANMHPGYQNPDVIGPSGPVDPGLTVLSVQSRSGRPIAVLANYSMHYYGAEPVSADYYGRFATALAKRIGAEAARAAVRRDHVAGHQRRPDVDGLRPAQEGPGPGRLRRRTSPGSPTRPTNRSPTATGSRWRWPRRRSSSAAACPTRTAGLGQGDRRPDERPGHRANLRCRNLPEVYAKEAIYLHDEPRRELKLQAIRIGELGITAIPNEVFAITGLKIKAQSPFDTTMNIELANGSEGYIPPPEQHRLGGYTTWPARTAGLEVQAEPKIVAAVLSLLEQVAGKPRRGHSAAPMSPMPRRFWPRSRLPTGGSTISKADRASIPARTAATPATKAASRCTCQGPPGPGLSCQAIDQPRRPFRGRPAQGRARRPGRELHRRALVLERFIPWTFGRSRVICSPSPGKRQTARLGSRAGHRWNSHRPGPALLFERQHGNQEPRRQDRNRCRNLASPRTGAPGKPGRRLPRRQSRARDSGEVRGGSRRRSFTSAAAATASPASRAKSTRSRIFDRALSSEEITGHFQASGSHAKAE